MERLTIKEVAAIYKVTTKTIRNWIKKGLPCIRIGNVLRFDINEVDTWTKEGR